MPLHQIRIHRMLKPCAGMTERERAGRGGGNGLGAHRERDTRGEREFLPAQE